MYRVIGMLTKNGCDQLGYMYFKDTIPVNPGNATIHTSYENAVTQLAYIMTTHYGKYFLTIQCGIERKNVEWVYAPHPNDGYD